MNNSIDIQTILTALPHVYPFILLDRIVKYKPNESILGLKNITINEPFFQGHFPDNLIMPGVLTVEGMAQIAGMLCYLSNTNKDNTGKVGLFRGIEKVKFINKAIPGDTIFYQMILVKSKRRLNIFSGYTFIKDGDTKKIITRATLSFFV